MTPKMTSAHGSGMRGSRRSSGSRSGLTGPIVMASGLPGRRPRRGAAPRRPARSVRCSHSSGRPRPARACRSPAAWAACSSPNVYGRPGTSRSSVTAPVICRNEPDRRAALVVLAGGVQEPWPPAEGDRRARWPSPDRAGARPPARRRTGPGTPSPRGSHGRRSRRAATPAHPSTVARRGAVGVAPRPRRRQSSGVCAGRPPARICCVFSLLSVTLGWSNGLMPSSRPARAVAASQTRNCAPERSVDRHVRARRRCRASPPAAARRRTVTVSTSAPVAPGAVGVSTTTGRMPVPSLPVDSATSCSAQSPRPVMPVPSSTRAILSRPARGRGPGPRPAPAPGCRPSSSADAAGELLGLVEQFGHVDAGQRRRDHAERGQRAVAGRRRRGRPG